MDPGHDRYGWHGLILRLLASQARNFLPIPIHGDGHVPAGIDESEGLSFLSGRCWSSLPAPMPYWRCCPISRRMPGTKKSRRYQARSSSTGSCNRTWVLIQGPIVDITDARHIEHTTVYIPHQLM